MEKVLELVKKKKKKQLIKEKIEDFDNIDIKTATSLLESEGLPVYADFKDKLTTPWAIAKYIQLSIEEKELIEKVKTDIKELQLSDNIDIAFMKKFSCIVQFSKKFIEGEKQQAICLKYFLDEDGIVQYKIASNSVWCWDISKRQLKALLQNEYFLPEGNKQDWKIDKKKPWFKRIFNL